MAKNPSNKKRRRPSAIMSLVSALCAMVRVMFGMGEETGRERGAYESSLLASSFKKRFRSIGDGGTRYAELILEKSIAIRALRGIRCFLAALSLNVYGIFCVVYGITSVFMYYLSYMLNGKNDHGFSAVIVGATMIVCALPMLVTTRAALSVVSESKIMRGLLLSFLGVPEEKLKVGRAVGGTEFMFTSGFLALLLGILTYFWHPFSVPMAFGIFVVVCLVMSHPESGVVITVVAVPFLQFSNAPCVVLAIMLAGVVISYIFKLIRRRRMAVLSAESVIALFFCAFMLIAGCFTTGGLTTFGDTLLAVFTVICGYYLTYSLMDTEKHLLSCVRGLSLALIVLSLAGLWNLFYNGISDGVLYSFRETVSPIFKNNIIYLADGPAVFGTFAVLVTPLLFSYAAGKRSVKGIVVAATLLVTVLAATFIYGTYETVFALLLEFCLFWLLYSHNSMKVILVTVTSVATLALLYPVAAGVFDLPALSVLVERIMPLGLPASSSFLGTVKSTLEMLADGHLSGIGVGQHAFEAVHPAYANAVSAGASEPASLWLQILCWSGVGGAFCFCLFAATLGKNTLGDLATDKDRGNRTRTLALACGVFTALVYGTVSCLWSDLRMLYLFWVLAGLLSANIRLGKRQEARRAAVYAKEEENTDVYLRF